MKKNYVWYACYGSNLLRRRFLCYILGGQIEGASTIEPGCRDRSLPVDDRRITIHHRLFFSGHSKKWENSGVAFIAPEEDRLQETSGRMYLITEEQFLDVVRQENALPMDTPLEIPESFENGQKVILPGSYGNLLLLGEAEGHPVYSFTCSESPEKRGCTIPCKAYTDVIGAGLMETYGLTEEETKRYFKERIAE